MLGTTEYEDDIDLGVLAGSDVEFRAQTIYFLVLDRFAIGNARKRRVKDVMFDATHTDWRIAKERKRNPAVQWGGQWPKRVDEQTYIFLRRYRNSRCLVFLNMGPERKLTVEDFEFPDGDHRCLLSDCEVTVKDGQATVALQENGAMVMANGDRLAVIGDCPELGQWDLRQACDLECVNSNTWFGELPFNESSGKAVGYKFVIFSSDPDVPPRRESRVVRRRLVTPDEAAKWRDRSEE